MGLLGNVSIVLRYQFQIESHELLNIYICDLEGMTQVGPLVFEKAQLPYYCTEVSEIRFVWSAC